MLLDARNGEKARLPGIDYTASPSFAAYKESRFAVPQTGSYLPLIGAPFRGTKISPGGVKLNFLE
jgi:hypothetical protein